MSDQEVTQKMEYPYILFRLQNDYYAVSCKNVASIMQLPEIEYLPEAPENVLGIFRFRDKVIPVISMRSLFGMITVEDEIKEFDDMMDARKQDHVNWVKEFDRCAREEKLFTLSANSHSCELGRWYDNFKPTSTTLKMQLQKMEEPHEHLHKAVDELEEYKKRYKGDEFDKKRRDLLNRLEKEYMPQVLDVLEGAKDVYQQDRRTLLVVIENNVDSFAFAVDEVLSVGELSDVAPEEQVEKLKGSAYISEIKKSPKLDRLVLMISDEKLSLMGKNYKLEKIR